MMKLSTYVCTRKKFCSDSWICETGNLKRDKFLLLWCWTVVVSMMPALARSLSSCLGLKDKKSGLEALALKQSLVECGTMIRWCHSAAQLGAVVTKDSDAARAPWELFVRRGFRWKLIHDPKFESSRNRANVKSTLWTNLRTTSLQTMFHEIRRVSRCLREMHVETHFRNFPSCPLLLDFGSLHQTPLILNIVMTSHQFRAS